MKKRVAFYSFFIMMTTIIIVKKEPFAFDDEGEIVFHKKKRRRKKFKMEGKLPKMPLPERERRKFSFYSFGENDTREKKSACEGFDTSYKLF